MDGKYCMGGKCSACWSGMAVVVGLIVLANATWDWLDWGMLIGLLLVVKGVLGLAMPACPHCKPEGSVGMAPAKKKR
ncbi:MAG: hypothetical protein HY518_01805 [Candidatus Aenigmarchaeota archaeon]|nr:hypothetical protein [Candidatus Aenigmarchaeota archaeon]